MNKNSVYAQTQTESNYKQDSAITSKQWKIYYYMLNVSKFDAQSVENHRYIYKNSFNISQVCRDLDIRSTATFYRAIERLEKKGLIISTETAYLLYARNWVEIDRNVMSNLIMYAKKKDKDIDLLRTFLILKKMFKIAQTTEDRSFTLRQLSILLGHGDTTPEYYYNIRVYLALLSFWGLIEVKQHKEFNEHFQSSYTIYHLQKISEKDLNEDFESDIKAEMDAELPTEELMNKLKFNCGELLNE